MKTAHNGKMTLWAAVRIKMSAVLKIYDGRIIENMFYISIYQIDK